jgi:hypothetical protein
VLTDWSAQAVKTVHGGFQGAARAELDAASDEAQATLRDIAREVVGLPKT